MTTRIARRGRAAGRRSPRPPQRAAEHPRRLAWKLDAGAFTESEAPDVSIEAIVAESHAHANGADVRRMQHHLFEAHRSIAIAAVFVNLDVADLNAAVAAIENLRWSDDPLFEAG